jgi:SAM-dependent methyltransferase
MKSPDILLNIGCGPNGLNHWLNFDWGILPLLSKLPRARRLLIRLGALPQGYDLAWASLKLVDIRKQFPLADGSVKFIYCSHVIEHFERWEALHILREGRRCLRDDGALRLVVPDIPKMIACYQQAAAQPGARPARDLCRLWWGFDKDIEPGSFFGRLSRRFIRDHQWNYDRQELELVVKEAGFRTMTVCEFRQGAVPDLDKLDIEGHKSHSIYAEAVK